MSGCNGLRASAHRFTFIDRYPPASTPGASFRLSFLYKTRTIRSKQCFHAGAHSHRDARPKIDVDATRKRRFAHGSRPQQRQASNGARDNDRPRRRSGDRHAPDETTEQVPFERSHIVDLTSPVGGLGHRATLEEHESPSLRTSTMSQVEKAAFEKLFKSLSAGRGQKGAKGKGTTEADGKIKAAGHNTNRLADDFQELEQSARSNAEVDRLIDGLQLPEASELAKYPAEIRDTVLKAQMRLAKRQVEERPDSDEDVAGRVVAERGLMREIEQKMYNAQTDVELWQILETDIFSDIRRIQLDQDGLDGPGAPLEPNTAPSDDIPEDSEESSLTLTSADDVRAQQSVSPSPKFSALIQAYPALLLLATRLAARRTTYSPMVNSVLPYLRSIGYSAHVLGASTSLYNEVVLYNWRVSHNTAHILALLRDMSHSGLAMDSKTLEILVEISRYHRIALNGDLGEAARAIETVAGRTSNMKSIDKLRTQVREELEQSAVDAARRADAEKQVRAEGRIDDVQSAKIEPPVRRVREARRKPARDTLTEAGDWLRLPSSLEKDAARRLLDGLKASQ